ncbi:MAG TPA: N-acetyltransferase [Isosphaeraceae bacterium]|nr:N-acetyltransferase [Isosphaeraceae bacterium]
MRFLTDTADGRSFPASMSITYYKRYRMEVDLDDFLLPPNLRAPFSWIPWDETLLENHAEVKYLSFRSELDSHVFPCLGDRAGCLRLMREIRRKSGFLPGATWLIAGPTGHVATIQGVMDRGPIGAIQNVGVVPEFRGQGLGRALVLQALEGFYQAGLKKAYLEVTAENASAVTLYRTIGFRKSKTLYKAVGT